MAVYRLACSCEGKNAICSHCFGTGVVEVQGNELDGIRLRYEIRDATPPHRRFKGVASKQDAAVETRARIRHEEAVAVGKEPRWRSWEDLSERKRQPWYELARHDLRQEANPGSASAERCPYCNRPYCQVPGHQRSKPHDSQESSTPRLSQPGSESNLHRCNACGRSFGLLRDLDAHLLAAHGRRAHEHFWKDAWRKAEGITDPSEFDVLVERLNDSVHAIEGPIGGRKSGPPAPKTSEDMPARADGGQDGAFGWGGSFRDDGEFGSYPGFDPMGDESTS